MFLGQKKREEGVVVEINNALPHFVGRPLADEFDGGHDQDKIDLGESLYVAKNGHEKIFFWMKNLSLVEVNGRSRTGLSNPYPMFRSLKRGLVKKFFCRQIRTPPHGKPLAGMKRAPAK